jgi:hypothetical protein
MSKNISEIPFTEIVERASELARESADVEKKVRGIVNDVYVRELPRKEDWSFLVASSALTLTQRYNTGTVSANTGSTSAVFSTDAAFTADFTGRKLRVDGNDYIYDVTYVAANSLTISPPFSGTQNVTSVGYDVFAPYYPLAADFDRFLKDQGVTKFIGGRKDQISEKAPQEFDRDYSPTPTDLPTMCRLYGTDTNGRTLVEFNPPPKSTISLPYDYIKRLVGMRETTAGFVTINSLATAVVGSAGTTYFTEARTGDYIRIDPFGTGADSEWYRIQTITHNSSLTLSTAFGVSGAGTAAYTICSMPDIPTRMHPALLYGTLLQLATDKDDPANEGYKLQLAEVLSDGKRIYKTRTYSQEIRMITEEYNYRR